MTQYDVNMCRLCGHAIYFDNVDAETIVKRETTLCTRIFDINLWVLTHDTVFNLESCTSGLLKLFSVKKSMNLSIECLLWLNCWSSKFFESNHCMTNKMFLISKNINTRNRTSKKHLWEGKVVETISVMFVYEIWCSFSSYRFFLHSNLHHTWNTNT